MFRNRYDPALNDIQLDLLPRVVSCLSLSSEDILCDFGSSTGRLIMASRLLTTCSECIGVELSPSRTNIALLAAECLKTITAVSECEQPGDAYTMRGLESSNRYKVTFKCGDICLPAADTIGTVYFLGIGRSGRKRLLPLILKCLCQTHAESTVKRVKVFCPGFTLPLMKGVTLLYGVTFPTTSTSSSSSPKRSERECGVRTQEEDDTGEAAADGREGEEVTVSPSEGEGKLTQTRIFDYMEETSTLPGPHENLRVYSKFYEPFYGDTMGPRVLMVFEIDLVLLSASLAI